MADIDDVAVAEHDERRAAQADSRPSEDQTQGKNPDKADKASASEKADAPDNEKDQAAKPSVGERLRQHWLLTSIGAVVLVGAIVGGILYWLNARHYESTDDAFVDARVFSVAAKVGGYVTDVLVTDNQHVTAGQPLAQIDERDYRTSVDQAQAQVANIDAQIFSQQAQIQQARDQADQADAQLKFAQQEAGRAQDLVAKGAGTVQQQQRTNSDLDAQQANNSRAKTAVTAAERQTKVLEAQKQSAVAQLEQAQLNLNYTKIVAVQPGRVVKLGGAKGAYVTAGQSLMMFVPDDIWITANFKETQVTDMRPGQPVDIRIDAYPDHKITGHIASVQPGSGTVFSLLPAENATGNYVKVVQRVPVKIVVDQWPTDVSIGPGMSVVPTAKVR
ncbi:MAG: HlyD family secretion protein [Tardiphaga sp.]|jgi:membrane fusion protein (multidrug efflux system)|nr:HlyD family secretion protein [Tardiphaga sp.]